MKEYGKNCRAIKMKKTYKLDDRITHSIRLAAQRAGRYGTSLVFSDGDKVVERSPHMTARDAKSGQFIQPQSNPTKR